MLPRHGKTSGDNRVWHKAGLARRLRLARPLGIMAEGHKGARPAEAGRVSWIIRPLARPRPPGMLRQACVRLLVAPEKPAPRTDPRAASAAHEQEVGTASFSGLASGAISQRKSMHDDLAGRC